MRQDWVGGWLPLALLAGVLLSAIWMRTPGPGNARPQAVSGEASAGHPPWISAVLASQDSRHIALVVRRTRPGSGFRIGGPVRGGYALWLVDLAAGSAREIWAEVAPMTGLSERPNGRELAFADSSWAIRVIDPTSGQTRRVAYEPRRWTLMWPAWAPDGSRVAFQANVYNGDGDLRALFSVDPDTRQEPRLEAADLSQPLAWDWDPGSQALVYVPDPRAARAALPESSLARRFIPPWPEPTEAINWSPDGSVVACAVSDELSSGYLVVVLDRSLKGVAFRAPFPVMSSSLLWSRKGQVLLFGPRADGAVCAYDVRNRTLELLSGPKLRGATPVASVEATGAGERFFFLSADRGSLVMSDGLGGRARELLQVGPDGAPSLLPAS